MAIDARLLEILACPLCKSKVLLIQESICCTNAECRRRYAVKDNIPVMLIDEATILDESDWQAAMRQSEA